ncbi:hypothetical protein J6590_033351 [Homalodisca vitripennis]|nr:hypothetical protein J6590_033351 [Homalodisca vitripennis]
MRNRAGLLSTLALGRKDQIRKSEMLSSQRFQLIWHGSVFRLLKLCVAAFTHSTRYRTAAAHALCEHKGSPFIAIPASLAGL